MTLFRIEVSPASGSVDTGGRAALHQAEQLGFTPTAIETTSIYLVQGDLDDASVATITNDLLCDSVTEQSNIGSSVQRADSMIEVHPQPGVMDPEAQAVERAIERLLGTKVRVQTGKRYDINGSSQEEAQQIAKRCFANTVVHEIHTSPYHPEEFPRGHAHDMAVPVIPISNLTDNELETMSRDSHLFLDLEEMQGIQAHYKTLGREPREIELETLAQTWSEHCVHKTLKATIRYTGPDAINRPYHEEHEDDTVTIHNLLKATVAAATY